MLMIEPRPCASMPGRNARTRRYWALALSSNARSQSAVRAVQDGAGVDDAGAVEEHVDRADLGGERRDLRAVGHVERARLAARSSVASACAFTSVAITRAPSRMKASALARPMPCAAAVISARFPASRPATCSLRRRTHARSGHYGRAQSRSRGIAEPVKWPALRAGTRRVGEGSSRWPDERQARDPVRASGCAAWR